MTARSERARSARRPAGWLAGLAALAAFLLPAPARAAGARVVAEPDHGPAGRPFTVTYTTHGRCRGGDATVSWDSTPIGTRPLDAGCGARMTIAPPAGSDAPGPHSVKVSSSSGTDSTVYTVDPPPPASPSAGPSASAGPPSRPPTPPRRPPSVSVAPTPPPAEASEDPCRPDPPAGGRPGTLAGAIFPEPVAVGELNPSRVRPPGIDLSGHPQIRLTVDALADPGPVTDAVGDGSPQPCLHLALGPGDGYDWAAYAFRDVVLTGYQPVPGTRTAALSFSYGGAAWRFARAGGAVVSGDTASPPTIVPAPSGWLMPVSGMVLLAAAGGAWWWLRRTRHVGTRRAAG